MRLSEAFRQAKAVITASPSDKVEQTVGGELLRLAPGASIRTLGELTSGEVRVITVGVLSSPPLLTKFDVHPAARPDWMFFRAGEEGKVEMFASSPNLLYLAFTLATEDFSDHDVTDYRQGKHVYPTFVVRRPLYDLFLTQHARTVRSFEREKYFRELARLGFSHAEVNGLAFPAPCENGPKGEVYSRFYTYCPSLDQFVSSKLNEGFYDPRYVRANLNYLKSNAELAERYGLTPGIVCFEPRSVPDALLEKYPMLRGARVDHPLRSFKPRYNLSLPHPAVRNHYAEMVENLMKEVTSLGYISIWSNDSGAGFEYTDSLYVGRNGGGYLVREWLGKNEIESAAAKNIVDFMKLIRDTARKINPNFRVLLRMEPFWAEHDRIMDLLEEGLDVEVSSLRGKGWELDYGHPRFEEKVQIHTTALHNRFDRSEEPLITGLANEGVNADIVFAPGVIWNHEPLIGIPFPFLVYEKLRDMKNAGVKNVCVLGGATPNSFAPFNINQELVRAFEASTDFDIAAFLARKSLEWSGNAAPVTQRIWKLTDDAVRSFPIPVWIYAAWGVWYRLAVRPLIPNIEAIPESEREYYEKFLLATPHNRTRVDLRYDVGFDLLAPDRAGRAVDFIDNFSLPPLNEAIVLAGAERLKTADGAVQDFMADQWERLTALKCWITTQRNVASWIAAVHTYLETNVQGQKEEARRSLRKMVLSEIENTRNLLDLWKKASSNWMIVSAQTETTFIYGENFGELLEKKIDLMSGHEDDEPCVDPDYQWRLSSFRF